MIPSIKSLFLKLKHHSSEMVPKEAYDIWSESYDEQPGNLMLDLDDQIFSELIDSIDISNKTVVDFGCGTGRHWPKIFAKKPALVMGFDISKGMLHRLIHKYPDAAVTQTNDNLLTGIADSSVDCLITTLTIAHIKNVNQAIASWSRVLNAGGDLIITDFHPTLLANGGLRSFRHHGKSLSVTNYIHHLEIIKDTFLMQGLDVIGQREIRVDEEVKHYYETQNALALYDHFIGVPIIYGLHLKKRHVAA